VINKILWDLFWFPPFANQQQRLGLGQIGYFLLYTLGILAILFVAIYLNIVLIQYFGCSCE